MKIELWYDPVWLETGVRLNGYWQQEDDIYSFLYPVRRYPLQTWLTAAGSWTGLRQQLSDVSRGEAVELEFHGRETDYADLCESLRGAGETELHYCGWDVYQYYEERYAPSKIDRLDLRSSGFPALEQSLRALCGEDTPVEWLCRIRTEEELRRAERSETPCVVVEDELLGSFEQLERLERLTRSLRRPMDAVCCCVREDERRETLSHYAWQFPRLRMRFLPPEDEAPLAELYEKYGKPYCLRKRLERYSTGASELLDQFNARCDRATERLQDLLQLEQAGTITGSETRELEHCRDLKKWKTYHGDLVPEFRLVTAVRALGRGKDG